MTAAKIPSLGSALLSIVLLTACQGESKVEKKPAGKAEAPKVQVDKTVTVYSGRSESLVGPLFKKLEASTGLTIKVEYGKTPQLVTRMMAEGQESPADVIFAQDSGHLGALADGNHLQKLPDPLFSGLDPRFSDENHQWVGVSGRLRTLVYATKSVKKEDMPKGLKDLADPKWKGRLGWAPGNGSFMAHVSGLRHLWGEDETKAWLTAVAKNEPTVYPKNSPQVAAARLGNIDIGWVNHYYLYQKDDPEGLAANYSFPNEKDGGNVLMVAGVGIRKGTANTKNAETLIRALLSEDSQNYFAQDTYEYPTRTGIATHAKVPSLSEISLAEIKQRDLSDIEGTRKMLQELGLQ